MLFPDFDGGGITLFYYLTEVLAQRMIDFGLQTQQGYLRIRNVTGVNSSNDSTIPVLNVHSGEKSWKFAPEPISSSSKFSRVEDATTKNGSISVAQGSARNEAVTYWIEVLSRACESCALESNILGVTEVAESQYSDPTNHVCGVAGMLMHPNKDDMRIMEGKDRIILNQDGVNIHL